ncbi:hypothetical protein BG015_005634 [Linnemannia schmuckeri]|uniref:BTB domain-containing protein n=1 Tax=Linnemannia schmuckeri TaxID=64567 RepID=A0A9P5VBZ8_9FUNG|nr:hypothetical protein BG015_005634 [Linnemannia schmuckeri]
MSTTNQRNVPSALIQPSHGTRPRPLVSPSTATSAGSANHVATTQDRTDRSDRADPINRMDQHGTTALHRAVTANQIDTVRNLLEHPRLNINEKDLESGWTAMHRALYLGHLRIALLLLQHKNLIMSIEDKDGNTALDVSLATLPISLQTGPCPGDSLYTWGSNANFTLGHNDGDDRKLPELVKFPHKSNTITFPKAKAARSTLYQLSMGKFHTAIATSEPGLTAKLWGFGTNGRLGLDRKMQLCPAPVLGVPGNVTFTALGRDHTVLLTSKGEVFTLGNNKYGQLGYALEAPKDGQDPIQRTPKRVFLNISKGRVIGAAASKWHTAIYTETELFTFGFNYGQLGYERKGDIQMGPRKVASIPSGPILQVVASDSATACLMSSNEVIVLFKYAYHRVSFSLSPFPDWFSTLNSPAVASSNRPKKITCTDNKFGMLTGLGDVHVWAYPEADSSITLGSLPANHSISFSSTLGHNRPRRIWTSVEDRTHIVDFALGQNGSAIVLTKGGHVYIGTNKGTLVGRNVKWQRVPHLDRVVQVFGNSSGAWAALRSGPALTPIAVSPSRLGTDLEQSLSQFHLYRNNEKNYGAFRDTNAGGNKIGSNSSDVDDDDDDDQDDSKLKVDPWRIDVQGWQDIEKSWDYDVFPLLRQTGNLISSGENSISGSHLFDVEIQTGKRTLGAHRIILAARSPVLRRAFVSSPSSRTVAGSLVTIEPLRLQATARSLRVVSLKVEFATAVLLLQFLYSDRFDPFWDTVGLPTINKEYGLKVRQELYQLALELSLPTLQAALQYSFTHVCSASLSKNMCEVLVSPTLFEGLADVRLLLKDGVIMHAHQMILGHRSPFFNAMFVRTDEWVRARQRRRQVPEEGVGESEELILDVGMQHMEAEAMALVLRYIYTDCGPEMFDQSEKDDMDDLIELVVDVLKIADEYLMDRLKEICENVLGDQVRAKTVVNFLEISLMHAAESLTATCVDFLCDNIEMALDQRWLEGVNDDAIRLVEESLKKKQDAFMPFTRSGGYLPDPTAVRELQDMIEDEGYRYFRPLQAVQSDLARVHRLGSHHLLEKENAAALRSSASEPTPVPPEESLPTSSFIPTKTSTALPDVQSSLDFDGGTNRILLALPTDTLSQTSHSSLGLKNRPLLLESPSEAARDILLSGRKASWGQVVANLDTALPSDGQDRAGATIGVSKPTLRDILEQELVQKHGQANSSKSLITATAGTPAQRSSKLSQKERRKQLQQQSSSSILDQDNTPVSSPVPQAWAKVSRTTALDLSSGESENSELANGNGTASKTTTTLPGLSMLGLQQSELALFRSQPKEVPRVAIATSKPVKETMRATGGERSFTEAPWRLDAIPEPLRAVTRHQSQMYPSLEASSTSQGGSKSQSLQTTKGTTSMSPLAKEASSHSGDGSSGISGVLPSPSMALSSFAIIQNQQLRDRNLLLRARHQKKSLYQIQIEEQALNQLRLQSLERMQARVVDGSGEWFTIGH